MNKRTVVAGLILHLICANQVIAQTAPKSCKIVEQANLPDNIVPLEALGSIPLELVGPEAFKVAANITLKHGYTLFRLSEEPDIAPNCIIAELFRQDTLPKDDAGNSLIDPGFLYNAEDVLNKPDELAKRNGWK